MIKIEKGYEIPQPRSRGTGVSEALRKMKRGESFTIPAAKQNSVYSSARYVGVKIVTRKQSDGTYRVWLA